ncbi:LysE family translocator [Paenibacillus sp. FSL K6-1566]|uniref:LysE family translocator n=1 Tax=Paenibacillus sp. FSL K6-1566 TaxID=2954515 RepID=UPI003100AAA5
MFTITSLLLFLGSAILLILVPGPDLLFAVTQGMTSGKRAGILSAIGLSLGNIVHTLAAALGVSIIIKTSATVFTLFKIAGACYLFYLAYKSFKHRKDPIGLREGSPESGRNLILKGFLMNVLNPKVAIFFLSFLPQFVNDKQGHAGLQLFILGMMFLILTGLIFGILAYFAGAFSQRLLSKSRFGEWMNILGGCIFTIIGMKLVFTRL